MIIIDDSYQALFSNTSQTHCAVQTTGQKPHLQTFQQFIPYIHADIHTIHCHRNCTCRNSACLGTAFPVIMLPFSFPLRLLKLRIPFVENTQQSRTPLLFTRVHYFISIAQSTAVRDMSRQRAEMIAQLALYWFTFPKLSKNTPSIQRERKQNNSECLTTCCVLTISDGVKQANTHTYTHFFKSSYHYERELKNMAGARRKRKVFAPVIF